MHQVSSRNRQSKHFKNRFLLLTNFANATKQCLTNSHQNPDYKLSLQTHFLQFLSLKLPSKDLQLLQVQRRIFGPSRTTLFSHPRLLFQAPSQTQSPTVVIDTCDISVLPMNIIAPPDSSFLSTSFDSLISNATRSLDCSATPQASSSLNSQPVWPRQLRLITMTQLHAQSHYQLETLLLSHLKSESTIQSKKRHVSHRSKRDEKF